MKLFSKFTSVATAAFVGVATFAIAFGGTASADCYQYNANGFQTSSTPVFNNICGVPELGNESDFVRIRQNPTTSPTATTDEATDPAYSIGTLDSTCNTGDVFDVWNYLHNDASPNYNPDTNPSDPSAVAHDVVEHMTAPVGTTSDKFVFSDTVTASNAASVQDSATLDCGGKDVQLTLVPSSVHTLTSETGSWNDISDNSINTDLKVGNPTWGSGDQWGCWNYRILIIYEVKVTAVTPPPTTVTPPTCNLLTLESEGQVAKIEGLTYTANSATVNGATIDFYNGKNLVKTVPLTVSEISALSSSAPYTYSFTSTGSYKVVATINTTLSGNAKDVTSANCEATFTASTSVTPPPTTTTTPPPTTTTTPPPSQLVNTGPGSVIAIFAGASTIGAIAYRWFLGRRVRG